MIFMTRDQIRRYDREAIETYGMPGAVLMENAGRGAAGVVLEAAAGRPGPVAIVCGKGSNGGDGFVAARHLSIAGREVRVILLCPASRIGGDARLNLEILLRSGITPVEIGDDGSADGLPALLHGSSCVVDAILGTGATGEAKGAVARGIEAINACRAPVVSIDLPSGLDADTGRALGPAVRASRTVTFACLKRGLVIHPGVEMAGEISVVDIGVPARVAREVGWDGSIIETGEVAAMLPSRRADSHKGSFGHLLLIAGSAGKTGAALLAGAAALRSGAGLVSIAVPGDTMAAMEVGKPLETMLVPLLPSIDSPFDAEASRRLDSLLEGKDAVAIGPGCGVTASMGALLGAVLARGESPAVIDADGITLLTGVPGEALATRRGPVILTPHPGEMGRMIGLSVADVQADRIGIARSCAARLGAMVVLKGSRTVVATPGGEIAVNTTGNPGMATGGSGDVLTGVVGGLLAQSVSPWDAARAAVHVHGLAGDLAREATGEISMVAGDILERLPEAFERIVAAGEPAAHDRDIDRFPSGRHAVHG